MQESHRGPSEESHRGRTGESYRTRSRWPSSQSSQPSRSLLQQPYLFDSPVGNGGDWFQFESPR